MKTLIVWTCALLTKGSLMAQNYYMATQQARRANDKNNAEQQRIGNEANGGQAAAAPAAPSTAPAAPMDPALQATLKNVSSLQGDFAAVIASNGDKVALLNDLTQAAQGTKASADSVK